MRLGKVGQDVLAGPMKSLLFALLALMLGAGHSACAGVASNAATISTAHHSDHAQADRAQHTAAHSDHDSGGEQPAPCGPEDSDCPHCKAAQFYKASAKFELAGTIAFPPLEKAVAPFAETQALIRRKIRLSRLASQWRGPPTPTPVSLKIRLLT